MLIKIKPEYYVKLGSKMYPTWPGVLVALHENGLLGIEVKPIQVPSEANGWMAICEATVTMKGDGEREQTYTEIGDASPKNCAPQIAAAALRMAATRAKGRAGRDAIACGETLREEIPDEMFEGAPARAERGDTDKNRPQLAEATPVQRARYDPQDSQSPRQVVADGTAAALCESCGKTMTAGQVKVSENRFGGRRFCPLCQRAETTKNHIAVQSAAA